MATRKCKKCGWEISATSMHSNCPVCGTLYKEGMCVICGTNVTNLVNGKYCVKCFRIKYRHNDNHKIWKRQRRESNNNRYAEWLGKVKSLPKDYPTLTHEQWLSACRHFGGCAFCGDESIDSRAYFVPFKDGGRYCDWNIVPSCEKCAYRIKLIDNPFAYLERPSERKALQGIIAYLEERLNAAVDKFKECNK